MDLEKLRGIAVVARDEGSKLGQVAALLFDAHTLDLRAFSVRGRGHTCIVPLEQVIAVGTDALMVRDSQATQAGEPGSLIGLGAIRKLKVVDEAGTFLGTVRDVEIDAASGKSVALTARKGGLLGLGGGTTTVPMYEVRGLGTAPVTSPSGERSRPRRACPEEPRPHRPEPVERLTRPPVSSSPPGATWRGKRRPHRPAIVGVPPFGGDRRHPGHERGIRSARLPGIGGSG